MSLVLILGFAFAQIFPLPLMKELGLAAEDFSLSFGPEKPKGKFFDVRNGIELLTCGQDGKAEMVQLAKGAIRKISEDVSVATRQAEVPKP